jgi:uncharacterized protein (DUF302 family)
MQRHLIALLAVTLAATAQAGQPAPPGPPVEGLVTLASPYDVATTLDRLEDALRSKGINVIARVDHGLAGNNVGIPMRPVELVIFGNPRVGSHLMTSRPTAAIDLPMKMIAWEDPTGRVWLAYNEPRWIAARHGIDDREEAVGKLEGALANLARAAVAR